jgi:hypothetical protein
MQCAKIESAFVDLIIDLRHLTGGLSGVCQYSTSYVMMRFSNCL